MSSEEGAGKVTTSKSSEGKPMRWKVIALGITIASCTLGLIRSVESLQGMTSLLSETAYAANQIPADCDTNTSGKLVPSLPVTNLILALSGNAPGFFLEVEVLLKSILLNAPLDGDMTIHIMADNLAFKKLKTESFSPLNSTMGEHLSLWKSRHQISFRVYDVSPFTKRWTERIRRLYSDGNSTKDFGNSISYHTIGTWYRLMANEVLPPIQGHAIYMDSDIIILTNLQQLHHHINPAHWFTMGPRGNAGLISLDISKLPLMWEAVHKAGIGNYKYTNQKADQLFLRVLNITHAGIAGVFPLAYETALADGLYNKRDDLARHRPQIGMIHFNGGANSKAAWFGPGVDQVETFWITGRNPKTGAYEDKYAKQTEQTFGNAGYYIRLPWTWARHFAAAGIPRGLDGHSVLIDYFQFNATDLSPLSD